MSKREKESSVFSHVFDPKARIKVTQPRKNPSRENPKPDVLVYGQEKQGDGTWGPERAFDEDELTPIR